MKLAISIAMIGDQPHIFPCLQSVVEQTQTEHQIYLIENMASAKFIAQLESRFPQIKILHHPKRQSFAANHNQILQQTNADYVVLLNDDTLVLDHALDKMVSFLETTPNTAGIVGCTNLDAQQDFTLSCYPFPNAQTIVWLHSGLYRYIHGKSYEKYLTQAQGNIPFATDWVNGSCMMLRRSVLKQVGLLDEDFFLFYEEVDYCYRAKKAGFDVYQIPQAEIVHYQSKTTPRFVPLKLRGHYLGALYFLAKHGFRRDLALVRLWFFVELLGKSFIRGIGVLTGRPPDASTRLATYWDLLHICTTYQGQPARQLVE